MNSEIGGQNMNQGENVTEELKLSVPGTPGVKYCELSQAKLHLFAAAALLKNLDSDSETVKTMVEAIKKFVVG